MAIKLIVITNKEEQNVTIEAEDGEWVWIDGSCVKIKDLFSAVQLLQAAWLTENNESPKLVFRNNEEPVIDPSRDGYQ